jgi:hypothetical protein
MRTLVTITVSLLALTAHAQAPSFNEGDIYYLSDNYPYDTGGHGSAIVRVDPDTGARTIINTSLGHTGRASYDLFRQRLLVVGDSKSDHLVGVDPLGTTTTLIPDGQAPVDLVAPTADSRVFYWGGNVFGYLDVNNNQLPLLNSAGSSQYVFYFITAMIYDRGTNSLIISDTSSSSLVTFRRLNLSDDGTRVLSTDVASINLNSGPVEVVSLSTGPDTTIYAQILDSSESLLPRAVLLNPLTMEIDPFAYTGDRDVSGDIAGIYSSAMDSALIADTSASAFRQYNRDEEGAGTLIASDISGPGASLERAQFVEVPGWTADPTDYTWDGLTNVNDLGLLLANWGNPGATDLNNDGTTNGGDLGILLANWN